MKKIFFAIVMLMSSLTYAQLFEVDITRGSTLIALPGFTYIYDVDYYGDKYKFYVDVIDVKEDGSRKMNYRMENANNTSGTITISAQAMNEAIAQFNYFNGGDIALDDKTTVWVSKLVYDNLLNNGEADISIDGGETTTTLYTEYINYDFEAMNYISGENMTDLSYIITSDKEGKIKYWIHGNRFNPIILFMDLGWTIQLTGIQSYQ